MKAECLVIAGARFDDTVAGVKTDRGAVYIFDTGLNINTGIEIDVTAPILSDPSSIGTTSDNTPDFTFTSDEAGTISYAGSCTSADTEAVDGENTRNIY